MNTLYLMAIFSSICLIILFLIPFIVRNIISKDYIKDKNELINILGTDKISDFTFNLYFYLKKGKLSKEYLKENKDFIKIIHQSEENHCYVLEKRKNKKEKLFLYLNNSLTPLFHVDEDFGTNRITSRFLFVFGTIILSIVHYTLINYCNFIINSDNLLKYLVILLGIFQLSHPYSRKNYQKTFFINAIFILICLISYIKLPLDFSMLIIFSVLMINTFISAYNNAYIWINSYQNSEIYKYLLTIILTLTEQKKYETIDKLFKYSKKKNITKKLIHSDLFKKYLKECNHKLTYDISQDLYLIDEDNNSRLFTRLSTLMEIFSEYNLITDMKIDLLKGFDKTKQ